MRSIREENDWTLEEMAERLGTTKQALSKYEREERTPNIKIAAKFAKILNVSLPELAGEEPKKLEFSTGEISIPFDENSRVLELLNRRLSQEDEEINELINAWRSADDLTKAMVRRALGIERRNTDEA